MSNSQSTVIDLDEFIDLGDDSQVGASTASVLGGHQVSLPESDRICLVGILTDDSGSMDGLQNALKEGLDLSVEAFEGARGTDFHLEVTGFNGNIFSGLLKDVEATSFDRYRADYSSTPLVECAIELVRELRAKAEQYQNLGVPTTIALLLMTDGIAHDSSMASAFKKECGEYVHYAVGMGIVRGEDVRDYRDLFTSMGITKIMTPRAAPADVRHAINQFSQSVASVAAV